MTYEEILKQIVNISDKLLNKEIAIFGTGTGGKYALNVLKNFSFSIKYFCDNDKLKWGSKLFQIDIKNPLELSLENKDKIVILIASMYSNEIIPQLESMGYKENHNIFTIVPCIQGHNSSPIYYEKYGFSVGRFSYGFEQFFYQGVQLESIGAFCSIAPKVQIVEGNHPIEFISTHPFFYHRTCGFIDREKTELYDTKNGKVIIGNDVWIGTNVTILPKVKIRNGVVIGAGAVVTKDIPDYAIVVGVPARILKYRFSQDQIELLNKSQWWGWPIEKIKENIELFSDNERFFEYLK